MRKWQSVFTALVLSVATVVPAAIADEQAAQDDEAVKLLSDYLKVDTTNPPGNEARGARHLAGVLNANGIETKLLETAPGREIICARLKGNGTKRPLILLNHIDVVPAQAADWKHPPFSGKIVDGEIWGRGAIDMKGMAIAELVSLLQLKRTGKPLNRDVIFVGTPDEEAGAKAGVEWLVKNHPELVKDAEFVLNEGYFIEADASGTPQLWGVDVAEKSVLWLKLTTHGDAGHGSMPKNESAPNRLIRALSRVVDEPASEDPLHASMRRNTVSLTVLKAGYKTNVIPAEATAELDCRLLPDTGDKEFIEQLRKKIDDPAVEIETILWVHAPASGTDNDLYKAIKEVAAEEHPGVKVEPVVVPWFTDSHWFRELGATAFGFMPIEIDGEHLGTMHGKNERVPVRQYVDGVRRFHKIISKLVY